jgi:transposase
MVGGKSVVLCITKQRWQCKYCPKLFTQPLAGFKGQRMTDHFNQLVQEKSRNQDFSSVAKELAISPATVMRKQDLLPLPGFQIPEYNEIYLGLDGKHLGGKHEIFVMGDVKERKFFGVTKDNNTEVLRQTLQANLIDQGKTVVSVSIDMSKTFKGIADTMFPDATIVVDKFHVIKYVNKTIDLCRTAVEKHNHERFGIKRLLLMKVSTFKAIEHQSKWQHKARYFKELLMKYPEIEVLWTLKNKIHDFYAADSKEQAEVLYQDVLQYLDHNRGVHPEFNDLKSTLLNWQPYILNHFDHGITNAYIEGLNNKIETLKRKKYGYRDVERFLKSVVFSLLPLLTFISDPIFINQL